jgi:hypothetical protein
MSKQCPPPGLSLGLLHAMRHARTCARLNELMLRGDRGNTMFYHGQPIKVIPFCSPCSRPVFPDPVAELTISMPADVPFLRAPLLEPSTIFLFKIRELRSWMEKRSGRTASWGQSSPKSDRPEHGDPEPNRADRTGHLSDTCLKPGHVSRRRRGSLTRALPRLQIRRDPILGVHRENCGKGLRPPPVRGARARSPSPKRCALPRSRARAAPG